MTNLLLSAFTEQKYLVNNELIQDTPEWKAQQTSIDDNEPLEVTKSVAENLLDKAINAG